MRNECTILKAKYDGSIKRERTGDLVEVRDDWLVVYCARDRHRHLLYGEPVVDGQSPHMLLYFNTASPLTVGLCFDERGEAGCRGRCGIGGVDAALPATLTGRLIRYVDLDLDLELFEDVSTAILDEDDFAEHTRTMAYPPEVVAAAREGIRLGQELFQTRAYPFDGSASMLLGRILASEGPL